MAAISFLAPACLEPTSATPYPNGPEADFSVRGILVEDGSSDQPLDRPLVVTFTDRVAPRSLNPQNVRLSREGRNAPALLLRQDMVRCSVAVEPTNDLEPGSVYKLTVSKNLTSWSGVHLSEERSVSFTTGTDLAGKPPRRVVTNEAVQTKVFDRHCGCCHDPNRGAYAHILALDASSLVGMASRQEPGMALVTPGSHEESYLLHKVLGMPGIQGEPMPPPDLSCGEPWPRSRFCSDADEDLELLADWIFDLGRTQGHSEP